MFYNRRVFKVVALSCTVFFGGNLTFGQAVKTTPNIVLIYTDDVGFGDISSNGFSSIKTPNIDKLAASGVRFTNVHTTSATCTPSRYSLLTGTHAWRQQGTGIAPGDAALLIPTNKQTMPAMLQKAGYHTAVIGKWHLGLGPQGGPDWNNVITPGPNDIGFNYSYLIPATGDRVPCVFVENQRIVNLDPADPIKVSYKEPIDPAAPTGKSNPELLKMQPSHGHDQTIVNGVSRIGFMTGGQAALWKDEDIADIITQKAVQYIDQQKSKPFFLYFSTHDIHVPRMPHPRYVGKSGMGPRGDALLQLDETVGNIVNQLEKNNLLANTLIIFTSDNGAVIDDGYQDMAVEKLGNHKPGGAFRGGKYSAFEGGTRVPFIVSWKGTVKAGATNNALLSQVDLFASFAALTGQQITEGSATDSKNYLASFLNTSNAERPFVIEQSINNTLSIIAGQWKYIEPSKAEPFNRNTSTELGYARVHQLYNIQTDIGEKNNLAVQHPDKVAELSKALAEAKR